MTERQVSPALKKILEQDVKLTDRFVAYLLQFSSFKSLKIHCKMLEVSCDGIAWLATWVAFIWLLNSSDLHQMQVNMLIGLLLDIVVVALLKAFVRRRRPMPATDMLTIGPDKFSFPSGHASRAFYILVFFTHLYSLPIIFWMPLTAWAVSVVLSRLILKRHYILDVCAGALIGVVEALFLGLIWLSADSAAWFVGFLSEDKVFSEPN
ncbi:polyisoprenoid diphosphate/phosphate phosphohydrolase PLPP6 [Drosophila sulfurigaster albostrigata]|uniref:polyisoprenoid diphosphate/phosphate phosphohydrolase PLPP6 n=1 Tax=Drosophila nasuta TaxID=42062 RepID=UPI00295E842B|nr:polyisoprenoid diphosphate/phosphate phosphohydrolase PLPP6 [Drosophila nasuta]XP_062143156.1 polyisoprenoid diphosphate/phosphate phosphohydrolase PLPP6 [Drosophila sulfurigaster albostrigata]